MIINYVFENSILNSSMKGLDYPSLLASAEGGDGGSFLATKNIGIKSTVNMML